MEGDSSSAWDIGEIDEVHTVAGLIGAVVGAGTAGAGDADAVAVGICRAGANAGVGGGVGDHKTGAGSSGNVAGAGAGAGAAERVGAVSICRAGVNVAGLDAGAGDAVAVAGLGGDVAGAGTVGDGAADGVAVGGSSWRCRAGAGAASGGAHTVGIHPVRAVPHGQLRIEGRIIFDFTCSGVYHCIKEWAEAIFHVYVFFEATLPQTLQISNDKRILIVRSKSLGATDFRFYFPKDREDRVDGFASGNPTVPPAFIL